MDNRNKQQNSSIDHLGVNKLGKNIRKTPLQQPDYTTNPQSQPHVYNINKNDFRSFVQQLTGLTSQEVQLPPPPPPPGPPSATSSSMRLQKIRPPPLASLVNRPQLPQQPNNTTESPVTAYMRYLQNSIVVEPSQTVQVQQPQTSSMSPLVPSPSGFLNLISPKSPFPLLSPGYQFPYPLTPNFPFSPLGLSGILGTPGPQQPSLSPGFGFSLSPSGIFPFSSPRWRDH